MTNKKRYKGSLICRIFLVTFFGLTANLALANEKIIQLTANQCSVSISIPGGADCDSNQCAGDSTCICAEKGKHIKWTINGDDKFKLKFSGSNPLHDNCGKNYKKGHHKCKIKDSVAKGDSFTYDIRLQSCANGTDPKIVIK